jgi:hypothetical protein
MKPFITPPRYPLKGKIYAISGARQVYYEQFGPETDIDYLQYLFDLLVKLANRYPKVLALGPSVAPLIQNNAKSALAKGDKGLRPITLQLLEELTHASSQWNYQTSHKWCPRCLARCVAHEESLSLLDTAISYRCRVCDQGEEFMEWAGSVTAVLDRRSDEEITESHGALRVNWLAHRNLFDFDRVEIIQATDEEVERFAVQIGNDTDEWRRAEYKRILCTIQPSCELTENTLRILSHTFGLVEVTQ